ncbi:MAG: GntR family transcriptional regulator [Acidobacteriota bacterium]|nr:GntR family transcriptional regulator [Acidobacteriota bacterium]
MTGLLTVDHRHPTPLYAQVERGIRAAIATGRLGAGDQLPTVRELAVELKINANTVARVYLDLERAGVLQTRRGIGSFVAAGPAPASKKPGTRDPELRALVQRCLDEAAVRGFSADDVLRQVKQSIAKQGG